MLRRAGLATAAAVLCAACGGSAAPATTALVTTSDPTTTSAGRTTAQVVIPAAAFVPASSGVQYYNNGSDVRAEGSLAFYAPVWFPARLVRIESMTLVAYDPTPDAQLCLELRLDKPFEAVTASAGEICTGTGPVLPQIRSITDLDVRDLDTATEVAYLYAYFDGSGVFLGAVQITYSY